MTESENSEVVNKIYVQPKELMNNLIYSTKSLDHDEWVIICECGAKIFLIPDLNEMALRIGKHAQKHEKTKTDPKKALAEYNRIEKLLSQKVLASFASI